MHSVVFIKDTEGSFWFDYETVGRLADAINAYMLAYIKQKTIRFLTFFVIFQKVYGKTVQYPGLPTLDNYDQITAN